MPPPATRHALHLYKRLINLAKQLPGDKKESALNQIRQGFRDHVTEKDKQR